MRDGSILDRTEGVPSGCPDTCCRSNCESLAQSCIALCSTGYVPELSWFSFRPKPEGHQCFLCWQWI